MGVLLEPALSLVFAMFMRDFLDVQKLWGSTHQDDLPLRDNGGLHVCCGGPGRPANTVW